MSVLSCVRHRCDNIMCRTYVSSVGYICRECQAEFKAYIHSQRVHVDSERAIIYELKKFMETAKNDFGVIATEVIDDFFKEHTQD